MTAETKQPNNERVPIELIGGPMDEYRGISVHNLNQTVTPDSHHRQIANCESQPWYTKLRDGIYEFAGYHK